MGAQCPAYITVDRLGAPRCAGGICATTMDLARVGQLIVQNGRRGDTPIIPTHWIEDMLGGGDPKAWATGDMIPYFGDRPMHYRNKWYTLRERDIAFGLGVYGQNVFVDKANELVIAKVSSQPPPLDKRPHRPDDHICRGDERSREKMTSRERAWSGRRESNPRMQLGKLPFYH